MRTPSSVTPIFGYNEDHNGEFSGADALIKQQKLACCSVVSLKERLGLLFILAPARVII